MSGNIKERPPRFTGNLDQATEERMTKEELLSYAAGYTDGDGCITAYSVKGYYGLYKSHKSVLEIGSKSIRSVHYLRGLLGYNDGIKGYGSVTPESDGTFRIRYRDGWAESPIDRLIPYLYLKRRQGELVLKLRSLIKARGFRRRDGMPKAIRDERERIVALIQLLNAIPDPMDEHKPREKRRSFAYLAGILDSEGYLKIERKGNEFSPIVHVGMTDGFVSRWIKEKFGGYVIPIDEPNHQRIYRWGGERRVGIACLIKARRYMRVKREQADILIRLQRHKDLWDKRRHGGPLPHHVIRKRIAWMERVKALNHSLQCAGAEAKPTQPTSASNGPICRDGETGRAA